MTSFDKLADYDISRIKLLTDFSYDDALIRSQRTVVPSMITIKWLNGSLKKKALKKQMLRNGSIITRYAHLTMQDLILQLLCMHLHKLHQIA